MTRRRAAAWGAVGLAMAIATFAMKQALGGPRWLGLLILVLPAVLMLALEMTARATEMGWALTIREYIVLACVVPLMLGWMIGVASLVDEHARPYSHFLLVVGGGLAILGSGILIARRYGMPIGRRGSGEPGATSRPTMR
jgi:hypothetical protein